MLDFAADIRYDGISRILSVEILKRMVKIHKSKLPAFSERTVITYER